MSDALEPLRKNIDQLDDQIIQLLNQRAALAVEIGRIKQMRGEPLYVPARERSVLHHLMQLNAGPLSQKAVCRIYGEIMAASLALEHHTFVLAGGADRHAVEDAARFICGGNADIEFVADLDALAHKFVQMPDALMVVSDVAWASLSSVVSFDMWCGYWVMPVQGSSTRQRFHFCKHPSRPADASHPALLYCVVDRPIGTADFPPAWTHDIPAVSCDHMPWPGSQPRSVLKFKLEISVQDARARWMEYVLRHCAAAWIV